MKKFKITYTEGDTINKTAEIEAWNATDAVVMFTMLYPNHNEITSVEEVSE